jgi:hypothetical protein
MRPVRHKHLLQGAEPDKFIHANGKDDQDDDTDVDEEPEGHS